MSKSDPSDGFRVTRGPHSTFDNSIVVEFLEPDNTYDATVLIRVTYKAGNLLLKEGKKHPQVPPYHLHFSQIETFKVLQGSMGVTTGYDQKDTILTPDNTPFHIEKNVPHSVWPDPNSTAVLDHDTVALIWAHPSTEQKLDDVVFEQFFLYLDECYREKRMPDLVQMLVTQHATDSALVILPSIGLLGPLRWGIPWLMQAGIAAIGRTFGYTPEIRKYMKDK